MTIPPKPRWNSCQRRVKSLTVSLLSTAAVLAICASTGQLHAQAPSTSAQDVLPRPEAPFGGQIGTTYRDSKADFPKPVTAPAGAPNVLIVILDDVGFGHAGTFGGAVSTPTMDRLAQNGLRHNQFHTTALCSPTRGRCLPAATITASAPASSSRWALVSPATPASFRTRRRACRKCCARTAMPPPLSANGTTRRTTRFLRPVRSTAGRPADLGLRVLLRLHERRDAPILSRALPQHRPRGATEVAGAGLPPHGGHGGRCDRAGSTA